MPTFFSTAVDTLYGRVRRSRGGHGLDHETLEALLRAPGVLEAAVTHSIHDFVWVATQGAMDEEARTASLMGHLASNLDWYALAAHWTAVLCPDAPRIESCNLFWAQQSRRVEAWRGADFGVAVRTGPEKLRIALYQAKRCDPNGQASLMRRVRDVVVANGHMEADPSEPGGEAIARDASGQDGMDLTALHQVHRLEIWRRRGIELLTEESGRDVPDQPWCRYAFWHDAFDATDAPGALAPTERSGKDLYDAVRRALLAGRGKSSFELRPSGTDFGMSLCFHNKDDLEVSAGSATMVLGRMKELGIPDFVAIDEIGGADADLPFWQEVFRASHREVTHVAGSGKASATPRPEVAEHPDAPRPGRG